MNINLREMWRQGVESIRLAHRSLETEKVGTLRGGNSGALLPDGRIIGKCHRLTRLRMDGIEVEEPSKDRLIMFEAGLANEDIWDKVLRSGDLNGYSILREEEVPTKWTTTSGINVTGRPDLVLADKESGEHKLGLEFKMAASLWTARDVLIQRKPKLPHLIQAAHYAQQLSIPFKLVYTSYVDFPVMGWAQKLMGKLNPREYPVQVDDKTGLVKKVLPFIKIYDLNWEGKGGTLQWKEESGSQWTDTGMKWSNIQAYYEMVGYQAQTEDLGPRPSNVDAKMEHKKGWHFCDYCPLSDACDKYDKGHKNYSKWREDVLSISVYNHTSQLSDGEE